MTSRKSARFSLAGVVRSEPLQLVALNGLAVAQPLYDLLGKTPEFFVTRHCRAADVGLFTGLGFLALPLALAALAELAGRLAGRKVRRGIYGTLCGLYGALLFLLVLRRLEATAQAVLLPLALAGGALVAAAWLRSRLVRELVAILAVLIWIAPVLFLGRPQVRALLLPGSEPDPPANDLPVAHPHPVVVVLFDELPVTSLMDARGRVDATLFPHFAELARTATWYRNATAVSGATEQAVPAVLTGRYPRDGLLPRLADHPRNLFTLLAASYDLQVREPRTELCPPAWRMAGERSFGERFGLLLADLGIVYLHLVLPPPWAARLPEVTTGWEGFGRLPDEGEDFRAYVAALQSNRRPGFYFLHSLLPHTPWVYLPSGKRYDPDTGPVHRRPRRRGRWVDREWPVIQAFQRHLLQLRFTDQLLGELLTRLRELDLFDRSLIIVAADHGISFTPGAWPRFIEADNFADVISVPLFVKLPEQREGNVSDRPAEVVDLLPTVAEVLGIDLDWPLDGRSLLQPDHGPRRRFIYNSEQSSGWIDLPLADRGRTLARKLAYFGSRNDPSTLYRIGPHRDPLIGRPVAELAVVATAELRAELDHGARILAIDPALEELPARVTGRLRRFPADRGTVVLALAVNGTVQAISLTLGETDPEGEFSFMVPEAAFRPGANEVALFRVAPAGDGLRLETIALAAGVTYTLEEAPAGVLRIRSSEGEVWEVTGSELAGEVVGLFAERYQAEVVGWARDPTTGELPQRVVAFADRQFLYAGELTMSAAELAGRYTLPMPDQRGFAWVLRGDDLRGEVRFFALSATGAASELSFRELLGNSAWSR